jgi:beta-N-acetylhexosaminidase
MLKGFNILLLLLLITGTGFMASSTLPDKPIVTEKEQQWVDSVFNSLNPQQRLGQLFMVTAFSNKDAAHTRQIERLVSQYHIGGLMFLQGGPQRQALLTNRYQRLARVPLFVAMDAEWGLDMRLDSSMHFAKQMTLGAIQDEKYVYMMGREIALKMKRLGVHISFSPVLDVNSNPKNPVIGNRSFGESKEQVSAHGIAYIRGLQDHGILAVAKHFPGHGNTDKDSHKTLPVVNRDMAMLEDVDLYPFKKSFDAGVMGVMVAHLHLPVFDTISTQAATLSPALVTGLLKQKMNYKGLVFTDALNMRSVTKYYKPGEVDALALIAGNDVLLYSEDVPRAFEKIREAVAAGKITQEEVDYRVRKVLHAKFWAGLNAYKPAELPHLIDDLHRPASALVQQQLYEQSATVVRNAQNLIPFRALDTLSFAAVSIGTRPDNAFTRTLKKYAPVTAFNIPGRSASDSTYANITSSLQKHDLVIVSLHNLNSTPANSYGVSPGTRAFIARLQADVTKKVVLVVMGNAYSLEYFENSPWLLCGYEDNDIAQMVVPQLLFGAIPAQGKLPVTAAATLPFGTGVETLALNRLKFGIPESVGMDSRVLDQIDNIAREAIAYAATPGCQVLVVKEGTVVFEKSYGHFTYDNTRAVTPASVYDIASISKVAATLQAIMFLKDQGKLQLDSRLVAYLPELKGTNKQNLLISDILAHQAGLLPGLPFWQRTTQQAKDRQTYYSATQSPEYPNVVAPGLYSIKNMDEVMWKWIIESPLTPKKKGELHAEYKYSDLDFYILKRVAEKLLNQNLDEFLAQNFYSPLGLSTMGFNPMNQLPREQLVPTENDTHFRKTLVWGTVHDQGAAMLGGVAGHAGLFSNAMDLAILMQMNLQEGQYGGHQYFNNPVISQFATRPYPNNRRGLGWDMSDPEGLGATSPLASLGTYGHTGFTGTCTWVDPESKLVYVFLSNRVNPEETNTKLTSYNIRSRIHDLIYKSLQAKT